MPAFNSVAAFLAWVVRARVVAFCCDLRAVNFAGNPCRAVALLVGLALSLGSLAANAQERNRRVALVIGNSSYETAYQIKNALNDVRDVGNLLVRAGFEVISIEDGSHEDIRRGLLKFERLLEKSRVGLFYFSGHGAQSRDGKRNLLLPVGQNYRDMSDIEVHGVDAAQVLDRMRIAGGSLNIVILDACRSERPLPDLEQKGMGSGKGLARMDTPSGSLIAFAAAPGQVALDDLRGNNSRYTKHLLQAMSTPGLGLSEVFQYVQGKVEDETLGAQSPELLNKLRDPRPFYFFEPKAEVAASDRKNEYEGGGRKPSAVKAAQYFPVLTYRTGAYSTYGNPWANGFIDYLKLVNAKGGINGVNIVFEECETGFVTDRGIDCYKRLKGRNGGATVFHPLSTGITFSLTEKATTDRIPLITAGYGRSESQSGYVFPWNFPLMGTHWSGADVLVQHVGFREGGLDQLKGKRIALVYHDSPYGREPIPLLQERGRMHGFELVLLPVTHPGLEQNATWQQIRNEMPDYVFLWSFGVMTTTALKKAQTVGYPREKMYGFWSAGAEPDFLVAGDAAKGYNTLALPHGAEPTSTVVRDILTIVYGNGQGTGPEEEVGQVHYIRGLISAMLSVEGVKKAQERYGKGKNMTGEQVRWGLENINLDQNKLDALGFAGMMRPVMTSCRNHAGTAWARIQTWNGTKWKFTSNWYQSDESVVRPLVDATSRKYAEVKRVENRTKSDCDVFEVNADAVAPNQGTSLTSTARNPPTLVLLSGSTVRTRTTAIRVRLTVFGAEFPDSPPIATVVSRFDTRRVEPLVISKQSMEARSSLGPGQVIEWELVIYVPADNSAKIILSAMNQFGRSNEIEVEVVWPF
jgi:branched-chain amino acid transport system substrate-binding protein